MIQNKHQYKVTNSKLKELEQSLAELADNPQGLSERLLQSQKAGLQVWIDRLKADITEYDRLQQGESVFKISSLAELPIALIKARIAQGMTQKELAEKIGVREQQIQRYEASHYDSASFDRLKEVYEALEISFKEPEIVMEVKEPRLVRGCWDYLISPAGVIKNPVDDNLTSERISVSKSESRCAISTSSDRLNRSSYTTLFN